jgi:hypothetical protein
VADSSAMAAIDVAKNRIIVSPKQKSLQPELESTFAGIPQATAA